MSTIPNGRRAPGPGSARSLSHATFSSPTFPAELLFTRRVSTPLPHNPGAIPLLPSTPVSPATSFSRVTPFGRVTQFSPATQSSPATPCSPAPPPYNQSPVGSPKGYQPSSNSYNATRTDYKAEKGPSASLPSSNGPCSSALHVLAAELGIELSVGIDRLSMQQATPHYATEVSKQQAEMLLNQSRPTKSKAKASEFNYKEVQRTFASAVGNNAELDVVDALLGLGASVDVARRASTNMFKRMNNTDQEDQRCIVLQNATRDGTPGMVHLLAAHAVHSVNLDDALLIAVAQQDVEKTRILLTTGIGADFSAAHRPFIGAISTGNVPLVALLLAATPASRGPCDKCKADGLLEAAKFGSLPMVITLLAADADTTYNDAEAFKLAISMSNWQIALAIAASRRPLTSVQLDEACAVAFKSAGSEKDQRLLLQICLASGATGPHCQSILQQAVAHGVFDIVRLLLHYGIPMDKDGGSALCSAVEQEQKDIFDALLQASSSIETLSNALASTSKAKNLGVAFATQLLRRGASPDFNNGEPLIQAILGSRLDILRILMSYTKDISSKDTALAVTCRSLFGQPRLAYLDVLLPACPSQAQLDACLASVVCERPVDHAAITLLLQYHASPEGDQGRAFRQAACAHDVQILELLAAGVSDVELICSMAAEDVIKHTSWRCPEGFEALLWLLEHKAEASWIDEAVVQAAVNYDTDALGLLADWIS
ncbi:hypothetical protein LTR17_027176, partial [Elasticomyces elasticus]